MSLIRLPAWVYVLVTELIERHDEVLLEQVPVPVQREATKRALKRAQR